MKKYCLLYLAFLLLFSCSNPVTKKEYKSPNDEFGELFRAVQLQPVFANSKTFVDCVPKFSAEDILKKYAAEKTKPNFDLKKFVGENFSLPKVKESSYQTDLKISAEQHINRLWQLLALHPEGGGSLIPMRKTCLASSGHTNEIYYWDTYFTMLGLPITPKDTLLENTVLSYAQLIENFGHVPGGNRSYSMSRSQPPFFALMVKLLAEKHRDKTILRKYLPQIQKEYQYWMAAETQEMVGQGNEIKKKGGKSYLKVVFIDKENILNRYFDYRDTPRPEAYKEDIAFAKKSGKKESEVYRNLRSGVESGWNFSSRWLADGRTLSTIHTTEILPIDLNVLLYNVETTLAEAYEMTENKKKYADSFRQLAEKRKNAINKYCWNEKEGFYFDYDFVANRSTNIFSLAAIYPLFLKMASPEQAQKVAKVLQEKFLQKGGLTTTLQETGQAWDAPNGFAPLQWMAIQGLRNYGLGDLSNQIKKNWVENNLQFYKNTGKMLDKYNVYNLSATNERYPYNDGFGWTNGVLAQLLAE